MVSSRIFKTRLVVGVLLLSTIGLLAQNNNNNNKKPAPAPPQPARPAPPPPPRPAPQQQARPVQQPQARPASQPSGAPNTAGSVNRSGPTTTTMRSGPTTNGPTVGGGITTSHTGPSANGITTHAGPTANGPATSGPATARPNTTTTTGSGATGSRTVGGTNAVRPSAATLGNTNAARPQGIAARPNAAPAARPVVRGVTGRPAPMGSRPIVLKSGSAIQRRPDGHISDVHDVKRGMDIHHELNGGRRISVMRPDHSMVVAERGRPGFVQRSYAFHGHDFAQRTYYDHGHVYQHFYRGAYYHGVAIHVYAPERYYAVGFYGWAYHPWGRPVAYSWGWGPNPWYHHYGYYFTPYPVYPSASYWLTDYIIASDLQAAYAAGQESAALDQGPPEGAVALTPEVKGMIANEVQNQIALENAEAQQNAQNQEPDPASSGIARMLSDGNTHIFVAGSPLDVVDESGNECALSEGDALKLAAPPSPNDTAASLIVLSGKGGHECSQSATVTIALDDLQEMQNHMRETIDRGMAEMQAKQGKGGLPAAPPSAITASSAAAFAQLAPPPDPNAATEINQQLQAADQSEQDVTTQASQAGDVNATTPSSVSRQ